MGQDIHGEEVSEEEVAAGLGFDSVFEFRRWQTNLGREYDKLKYDLFMARSEAKNFQWTGRRQQLILRKADETIKALQEGEVLSTEFMEKLRLAIAVVTGSGVDWNNTLDDWLEDKDE